MASQCDTTDGVAPPDETDVSDPERSTEAVELRQASQILLDDDEILVNGSTLSVLTSFNCSTQSKIEFISFKNSLDSFSDNLILASLAILFIVFVSNFNLYVSND